MKKSDSERVSGITRYAPGQFTCRKDVTADVLRKIFEASECAVDDIMKFIPEQEASHD